MKKQVFQWAIPAACGILDNMEKFRIFVINPGSTSTKLAMFENEDKQFECDVFHDSTILRTFPTLNDQVDYRMEVIFQFLKDGCERNI